MSYRPYYRTNQTVLATTRLGQGESADAELEMRGEGGPGSDLLTIFVSYAPGDGADAGLMVQLDSNYNNGADGCWTTVPFGLERPFDHTDQVATAVDADSAAGQQDLNVDDTTGFEAGDQIIIAPGVNGREELAQIESIDAEAGTLTLRSALAYAHAGADEDEVHKLHVSVLNIEPRGTPTMRVRVKNESGAGDDAIAFVHATFRRGWAEATA